MRQSRLEWTRTPVVCIMIERSEAMRRDEIRRNEKRAVAKRSGKAEKHRKGEDKEKIRRKQDSKRGKDLSAKRTYHQGVDACASVAVSFEGVATVVVLQGSQVGIFLSSHGPELQVIICRVYGRLCERKDKIRYEMAMRKSYNKENVYG